MARYPSSWVLLKADAGPVDVGAELRVHEQAAQGAYNIHVCICYKGHIYIYIPYIYIYMLLLLVCYNMIYYIVLCDIM